MQLPLSKCEADALPRYPFLYSEAMEVNVLNLVADMCEGLPYNLCVNEHTYPPHTASFSEL